MNVTDSVEHVRELAQGISLSIELMHAEWSRFFNGMEYLIPDSVDRLIALQREMLACIEAIQFDAQGTVGNLNDNQEEIPDIIFIESDSDDRQSDSAQSESDNDTNQSPLSNSENNNTMGNNVMSRSSPHREKQNEDCVTSEIVYQQCPICLNECNGQAPVSIFHPCSHFIHTLCLDRYNETVSYVFRVLYIV